MANGLGNLVSRILQMSSQYLDKSIDIPDLENIPDCKSIHKYMSAFEFNRVMDHLWSWIKDLDELIDEQKPFVVVKKDRQTAEKQLVYLLTKLAEIAVLLSPFMPNTSNKVIDAIKENKKPENLFPRIN